MSALVDDGFAILKVGPGLTFALREALYGLDAIADCACREDATNRLVATMEAVMVEQPASWTGHYGGSPDEAATATAFQL